MSTNIDVNVYPYPLRVAWWGWGCNKKCYIC